MSQQSLPSPSGKVLTHTPSRGKINAPANLIAHLGPGPNTPKGAGKKFIFPQNRDGTHLQSREHHLSTSSASSIGNTPRTSRKEFYRPHSSDDLLRYQRIQNMPNTIDLNLKRQVSTVDEGHDNHGFAHLEDTLSKSTGNVSINSSSGYLTITADATGNPGKMPSGAKNQERIPSSDTDPSVRIDSQSSATPSTVVNAVSSSITEDDTQSVFTDTATTSTFNIPEKLSRESVNNHGWEQGITINVETDLDGGNHSVNEFPLPTSPKDRKKWLVATLSTNLSIIYILNLVVVGIVCYLMDMYAGEYSNISEAFNIYLMTGQIVFLAYIHISVMRYKHKISGLLKEDSKKRKESNDMDMKNCSVEQQTDLQVSLQDIPQEYGFTGSHGGSLYLKIGAAVFCMGHLIFSGLELASKYVYILNDDESFHKCTSVTDIAMSLILIIYVFYQLFFAFKFSNLIINKRMILSKFGIMHCIGSSLCYWIYMIIQETLASLLKKQQEYETHLAPLSSSTGSGLLSGELKASGSEASPTKGLLYLGCENSTEVSTVIKDSAPYLYPFSIEFNILMVGFWILLWENHGKIEKHSYLPSVEVTYEEDNSRNLTSNLTIYVDCHASSRGLFSGLFLTIIVIITIILFIVFSSSETTLEQALLINSVTETVVLVLMLISTGVAFYYTKSLDVIKHKISSADDILLYICLPSVYLYALFILVPYGLNGDYIYVAVNILRVVQSVVQTILIVDGLRRCSNTKDLQNKKPGREVLIFLVVMNVACWLLMSFQIVSTDGNALLYDFYGKELWTTVSHLTLPLSLFYRFHSSVCLADIWKDAYEPDSHH